MRCSPPHDFRHSHMPGACGVHWGVAKYIALDQKSQKRTQKGKLFKKGLKKGKNTQKRKISLKKVLKKGSLL